MAQARELFATASLSELIDLALTRLVDQQLERRHAAGYLRHPPEQTDDAWADVDRDPGGVADDVDWAGLYGVSSPL